MGLIMYTSEFNVPTAKYPLPRREFSDGIRWQPREAASQLCRALSDGFVVTALNSCKVNIRHDGPGASYTTATLTGSDEDMTILRRVVLLWACGYELETLLVFLLDDELMAQYLGISLLIRQTVLA